MLGCVGRLCAAFDVHISSVVRSLVVLSSKKGCVDSSRRWRVWKVVNSRWSCGRNSGIQVLVFAHS